MATSTADPPRRTQAQRRDTARTAILETAIRLLADGGYGRIHLADVGERAGYIRSLATHYFGPKPQLLAAIIDHVLSASPPRALDGDTRGIERVDAEIASLFAGLRASPQWVRAYIVIAHEAATSVPELRSPIHEQNLAFRERIHAAIEEGIRIGQVRADVDATSASITIMAMARGIAWEWFTDPTLDLAQCEKALTDHLGALRVRPRNRRR